MGELTNMLYGAWNTTDDDTQVVGIEGFTALIRMTEVENYTTQVTENPLESGAIVNDHLITDPYTISMTGVITKEHIEGVENFGIVGEWVASAGVVTQYLPPKSKAQMTAAKNAIDKGYNLINKADAIIDDGKTVAGLLGIDMGGDNVQQFRSLMIEKWQNRQPIKLQMRGHTFSDMAIVSVSFDYDNVWENMGFSMELKKLNIIDLDKADTSIKLKPADEMGGDMDASNNKGINQLQEIKA